MCLVQTCWPLKICLSTYTRWGQVHMAHEHMSTIRSQMPIMMGSSAFLEYLGFKRKEDIGLSPHIHHYHRLFVWSIKSSYSCEWKNKREEKENKTLFQSNLVDWRWKDPSGYDDEDQRREEVAALLASSDEEDFWFFKFVLQWNPGKLILHSHVKHNKI